MEKTIQEVNKKQQQEQQGFDEDTKQKIQALKNFLEIYIESSPIFSILYSCKPSITENIGPFASSL